MKHRKVYILTLDNAILGVYSSMKRATKARNFISSVCPHLVGKIALSIQEVS